MWKKITRSPVTLIVLLIVFVFMARASTRMYLKSSLSNDRLIQAKKTIADLEAHKTVLSKKVDYLSTMRGIESEIRTKFRAAMEGESVAVIVGDAPPTNISEKNSKNSASSTISQIELSWRRLLQLVGL